MRGEGCREDYSGFESQLTTRTQCGCEGGQQQGHHCHVLQEHRCWRAGRQLPQRHGGGHVTWDYCQLSREGVAKRHKCDNKGVTWDRQLVREDWGSDKWHTKGQSAQAAVMWQDSCTSRLQLGIVQRIKGFKRRHRQIGKQIIIWNNFEANKQANNARLSRILLSQ